MDGWRQERQQPKCKQWCYVMKLCSHTHACTRMHISGIGLKLTNQRGHTCKLGAEREEGDEGEKKVKERDKMVQKRQR